MIYVFIMAEVKEKKSNTKSKSATTQSKTFSEMLTDKRIPIVLGILLLVFTFVLAMSLGSYVSTYQADESTLTENIGSNTVIEQTDNYAGPIGARLGALFIDKLFGIASFLFIIIFGSLGINLLLRRKIFKTGKIILYTLIFMSWFSIIASYIQYISSLSHGLSWGGAFGEFFTASDGILIQYLKAIGTGALLIGITGIAMIVIFNIDFEFIARKLDLWKQQKVAAAADAAEKSVVPGTDISIFEKDGLAETELPQTPAISKTEMQPNLQNQQNIPTSIVKNPDTKSALHTLEIQEDEVEEEEENADLEDEENDTVDEIPNESSLVDNEHELEIHDTESEHEIESDDTNNETELVENESDNAVLEEEDESGFEELNMFTNARGEYDPTLSLSRYKYPDIQLLQDHGSEKIKIDKEELEKNKNQIIQTLNNYKIEISKIMATVGPTVTLYEIVPAPGVRISKIKSLEDDIALSLAALGIRIIAPIPGKGTIGIEVPNVHKEVVSMRSMINSEKFKTSKMDLPICLGKTISNEIFIADLAKMPHLLMAGATGQGKSVGINSILVSLLYKKHPSELKFVMVDPKKVELSIYAAIEKHFLAKLPGEEEAIITDTRKVVATLNALCIEMDNRYDLLKKANVRNLKEYNAKFVARKLNPNKGHCYMPLIVVIVDEFADLIMTAGKEVEMPIARLAQLARAIGIHLVLATQRPSVNIITGTIKANFPGRISFKVASKIDSRTILDMGGAEQLIGRGDMLLSMGSDLTRLQCGFVDTPEVDAIVNSISQQQGFPDAFILPEVVDESGADGSVKNSGFASGDRDEMFEDAARIVVQNQMGSTSLIQRRLKLGYNRAGRLMDQLEEAGIVGPNLGSKAREVLYNNETDLERYLNALK